MVVKTKPVRFSEVEITDLHWNKLLMINKNNAIFHQWKQLEKVGTIDNFRILAGRKKGFREGFFFSDSDAYKWLDAACRIFKNDPIPELGKIIENFIELIQEVQEEDGYIFTYNQLLFPGTRWKNLWIEHELYCLGHLIEAAVSHSSIEEKSVLLTCAVKAADLLVKDFAGKGAKYIPGHQEVELALIKLYRLTGERKYFTLAKNFLERRGRTRFTWFEFLKNAISTDNRMKNVKKRKEEFFTLNPRIQQSSGEELISALKSADYTPPKGINRRYLFNTASGKYNQNHKPLRKQRVPEGHAVRFGYLQTAAAMRISEEKDEEILGMLESSWDHVVQKRMYVTGGIGSLPMIEGFGKDYELDPEHAYCESCAALSSLFWSWEMTLLTGNAKYADLFEWQLYNAARVGMGQDGTMYFYRNPLSSRGYIRNEWYTVACCPSNLSRTYAAIGGYIYSYADGGIWIHQYISNKATIQLDKPVDLEISSSLPWKGDIKLKISSEAEFTLHLRIPGWARDYSVKINGVAVEKTIRSENDIETASGYSPYRSFYLEIMRKWQPGDDVDLTFTMGLKLLRSHEKVKASRGKIAIARGPIVYCLESVDNPDVNLDDLIVDTGTLSPIYNENMMEGTWVIEGTTVDSKKLIAIPYYKWANRGTSDMTVKVNHG